MLRLILTSIVSVLTLVSLAAGPFVPGKKYRIESNLDLSKYGRSGAVGLASAHGATGSTYYTTGDSYTADCWWYIDEAGNGVYTIKSAQTGKYLTMKKRYEDCTLDDAPSANSTWRIKADAGALLIYINGSEPQYLFYNQSAKEENPAARNVITDRSEGTTPFKYFNIYDELGAKVNPADVPELDYAMVTPSIPAPKSDIKGYATDVCINGQRIAYASDRKFWLATMPSGSIDIAFKEVAAGVSLTLKDGDATVTDASQIARGRKYSLVTAVGGTEKCTSDIVFTTMPVLDIRHEGKLGTGMSDYLWGEFCLSSADTGESVCMTARFRSRGATASKYEKHSMNMKLRELGTDAETDHTLLGIREASSWILDAAAVDYTKMRNRVCFDIWNEFSQMPYETKFNGRNGTAGRFVEVIENGEYRGIYCLTDRINRKLLNLKKPKEEGAKVTVRGVSYKSNTHLEFEGFNRKNFIELYGDTRADGNLYCEWELKEPEDYPGIATWAPIDGIFDHPGNIGYYKEHFHWDNMIDYHLFVMAFLIIDNGNKNEFLSARDITGTTAEDTKLFFTPWDLDTALGGDANAVNKNGKYNATSAQSIRNLSINKSYPFMAMLKDGAYHEQLKARWQTARQKEFSLYNVTKKMRNYAELFVSNGAYEREKTSKGTMTVADLLAEVDCICQWYADQINALDDFFGLPHVPQSDAIDIITSNNDPCHTPNTIYDLQGRKVQNATRGVYIRNGKKVMVY